LIRKYQAFKNANDRIAELIIKIEGVWVKTETQIDTLREIRDSVNDGLLVFQEECLRRLLVKLGLASVEIQAFIGSDSDTLTLKNLSINVTPLRKVQYSIVEKHLRRTVHDLEAWHAIFDPSWFLISRIADTRIDRVLTQRTGAKASQSEVNVVKAIREVIRDIKSADEPRISIFRDNKFLSPDRILLPESSLALTHLSGTSSEVIVDLTDFPGDVDKSSAAMHVRDLGRLLSQSQPSTLGLLQCIGVVKIRDTAGQLSQFEFAFSIPPALKNPASLRRLLMQPPVSLDAKYCLSKSIARSVMAVHSADFVHKNIRPDTIVVFEENGNPLPVSFLVGFERFRPRAAGTNLTGDMAWEKNLYRHPSRQGIKPEHAYVMQHDVYSLGVCLLEIGLWSSFVTSSVPPQPGPLLDISEKLTMRNTLQAASDIKALLVTLATENLPSRMGLVYTEVVMSCLTCIDLGTTNMFASEKDLYDQDGILVGVAFIEKILLKLESISI
jgi:serine/threonine protein kinase